MELSYEEANMTICNRLYYGVNPIFNQVNHPFFFDIELNLEIVNHEENSFQFNRIIIDLRYC